MRDVCGFGIVARKDEMVYFIGLDPESNHDNYDFDGVIEVVMLDGEMGYTIDDFDVPLVGEWYFESTPIGILIDPYAAWFAYANENEFVTAEAAILTHEQTRVLN